MIDFWEILHSLKVNIAIFYFRHSKNPSNIMENIFNFISVYFWKKSLVNKYKRQMCYKKNKSIFDVIFGQTFSF